MKKMFFIAAAAVASMTACTNVEIATPENNEISFQTMTVSTKALVLPDKNLGEINPLPTTAQFGVFAFVNADYDTPLMNDVTIGCDATSNNTWKALGTTTYIWPASGNVDFYAYYPASVAGTFDKTTEKVKMTGVDLGSIIGDQVDPLVAVTKGQIAEEKPLVKLVFKHTASQILVSAYDATTTPNLQGNIVIKNVKFNNVFTKGDYTDGTTSGKGTWTNQSAAANFEVFSGEENLPVGEENESYLSQGSFTNAIDNNSAFVIVPEDVDPTQQTITVVYDVLPFVNGGYTFAKQENKTVTFSLKDQVKDNRFKPGVRYVFHLAFTLDKANNEIIFAPQVDGWETEDINTILIDVQNDVLI